MPVSTPRQTLNRLTVIVLIQWVGATLGLPLLALFLEHRGGSPHVIGLIVASFFVAGVLTQYFLGRLADRFGRRPILVVSLIAYGLASMTYALPLSAVWFTLTRVVQGASAGALEVASMSAVAALFAEGERGRAVSRILAAQLTGVALGPLAGVIASVNDLGWVFFVIADHLNRRLTALGGLLNATAFLATYPHIHNNVVMLFVGSAESVGASLCSPSVVSLLSQGALPRELSRRQGLYATATTASLALASIASGFLFTIDTALPFTVVALVSSGLAISTLFVWRGVQGRISAAAPGETPSA